MMKDSLETPHLGARHASAETGEANILTARIDASSLRRGLDELFLVESLESLVERPGREVELSLRALLDFTPDRIAMRRAGAESKKNVEPESLRNATSRSSRRLI